MFKGFKFLGLFIFVLTVFSCSTTKKIKGEWLIKKVEIDNFNFPDCKTLKKGDVLKFDNKNLSIYKDSNLCCVYNYFLRDDFLHVLSTDFSFKWKIINITNNNCVFSSKNLPKEMLIKWKESYSKYKTIGFTIDLEKSKELFN